VSRHAESKCQQQAKQAEGRPERILSRRKLPLPSLYRSDRLDTLSVRIMQEHI